MMEGEIPTRYIENKAASAIGMSIGEALGVDSLNIIEVLGGEVFALTYFASNSPILIKMCHHVGSNYRAM